MKIHFLKKISVLLTVLMFLIGLRFTAFAQSTAGRVSFGIDAEGNKLFGSFRDNQFWFSGDIFLRWNILDWLSLYVAYNGCLLRIKPNYDILSSYPLYFLVFT